MKKVLWVLAAVIVVVGGYMLTRGGTGEPVQNEKKVVQEEVVALPPVAVKEFTTTAFYDSTGVWYSLKEMRVSKGDTVRVRATNTKGMHDFVIDEFSVSEDLPLNEEVVIEFVADKTGEFIYYCSKMDHRAKGQWGKLIVE